MDDEMRMRLERLTRDRKLTPNVPPFERQVYQDGKRAVAAASAGLRAIGQNLIEDCDDHRHLRAARVLLLVESSEATARKLTQGERVVIGRASKFTPVQRVLASSLADEAERKRPKSDPERKLDPPLPGFDFLVKLSGDWLSTAGYHDGTTEGLCKAVALLDHELLHCGVRIAGEFVGRKELATRVENLGQRHVETCDDVQDDDGRILVRYQVLDSAGHFVWKMRRHDLEEFCGVVGRWGAWDRSVGRMVDVLVERDQAPLFDGDGPAAAQAARRGGSRKK